MKYHISRKVCATREVYINQFYGFALADYIKSLCMQVLYWLRYVMCLSMQIWHPTASLIVYLPTWIIITKFDRQLRNVLFMKSLVNLLKNKTMINVHRSNMVNGSSIIMFMYLYFNFKTQNNAVHNSNKRKNTLKINTEKYIMLHWGLFLLNFPKVNVNKILKENLFVI